MFGHCAKRCCSRSPLKETFDSTPVIYLTTFLLQNILQTCFLATQKILRRYGLGMHVAHLGASFWYFFMCIFVLQCLLTSVRHEMCTCTYSKRSIVTCGSFKNTTETNWKHCNTSHLQQIRVQHSMPFIECLLLYRSYLSV